MSERPIWFTDWRRLWHDANRDLGVSIAGYCGGGAFDGRRVRITKELYRQIRRVQRLRDRVEVESKVMDRSWCMDLLRVIHDHKKE